MNTATRHNGQAFILHIWDSQDYKCDPDKVIEGEWSQSWVLINYYTHNCGVNSRGFDAKMNWLAYVDSF